MSNRVGDIGRDAVPSQGFPYGKLIQIVGEPTVPYASRPDVGFKVVSPSFFAAAGLRLLGGLFLRDDDREGCRGSWLSTRRWPTRFSILRQANLEATNLVLKPRQVHRRGSSTCWRKRG